jgi:2-polyprenyl-6-methoxyphenol hydroxylase-like FAD-dependent oxidoreductase
MRAHQENQGIEPVVVVGAGPAGLTTAVTLARAKVPCLIVERRHELSSLPRATVVSTRSMELLRSWGIDDELRAGADDVDMLLWECESLARAATGTAHVVGYPSREQSRVVSPAAPTCAPQDHLEAVMMRHLRTLPHARVELGTDVVDVTNGRGVVCVTLRDVVSGELRVVRARFVVAADGARSAIRERAGLSMLGSDRLTEALTVQLRAPLWELIGPHRFGLYNITNADAPGLFLPAGSGDRWLYGFEWDPERESLDHYTDERLIRRIRLSAGQPDLPVRIERIGTFAFAGQMAERWRDDRVFLVGDAAHRVTPRGGTGMNTAIAGGFDLGWKLAWVLRGWASPTLLDTYEAERRPLAQHNLDRSLDPLGSRRPAISELPVDLAGRIPHAWLPDSGVSTLDLVGTGLTLFTTGPSRWRRAAAELDAPVPLVVRDTDAVTARTLGVLGTGALLVRPDGVPAGLWRTDVRAVERLRGAVSAITGNRAAPPHPAELSIVRSSVGAMTDVQASVRTSPMAG